MSFSQKAKHRSINDYWEVTQDRPSPYEPVKFIEENLSPCDTADEYVKYIIRHKPQAIHKYDENHKMPGRYTHAEIINNTVWVTFTPEKFDGKYWVNLK